MKPDYDISPTLAGFEHINRYWDPTRNIYTAKILPGEYYVSMQGEAIATVLGSCISACIRDRVLCFGGMNHYMLPMNHDAVKHISELDANRYGNWAMENLINTLLSHGSKRENLEIKLFGGAKVMLTNNLDVATRNIDFVIEYLKVEQMSIAAQDVGGINPRKVIYYPHTGQVFIKKLDSLHNNTLIEREEAYMHEVEESVKDSGSVELF